jgi:two-component sensor histidine kinase
MTQAASRCAAPPLGRRTPVRSRSLSTLLFSFLYIASMRRRPEQTDMREKRRVSRATRSIDLLVAASIVLPLLLFVLAAWESRARMLRDAEHESMRLVDVLHEHAQKVFETEALVIEQTEERVADVAAGRSDIAALQAYMTQMVERLPQLDAILVLGHDGEVRVASDPSLGSSGEFARGAAAVAKLAPPGEIAWTLPDVALTQEGPPVYGLARRAADGTTVVVTAAPLYFTAFWGGLVPRDGAAGLFRSDGAVLARVPARGDLAGPERAGSLFRRAVSGHARGIFHGASSIDGLERTYAYRRVDPWPVYLVFGIADRAVDRSWVRACTGYAALALLTSAALVTMALSVRRGARADAAFRAELERAVEVRTGELAQGLAEKELLVREIHHRVKNNMQTIMSLLAIQGAAVGGPLQSQFRAAAQRIETMASLHKQLYQQDEIEAVDFAAYLERLVKSLVELAGMADRIAVRVEAPSVRFALDLGTPLALIANEVLSNALKHAFPDDRHGTLFVRLEVIGRRITLTIEDDGVGSASSAEDGQEPGLGQGLGMRLVRSFARSLRADVEVRDLDPGTRIVIAFDAPEASVRA